MDETALLVALYADLPRQGPGGEAETLLALRLAGLPADRRLRIADIGCGTGAQTLALARAIDAEITAVDLHPAMLTRLEAAARAAGLADRVATLRASMDALPFEDASLDAIWSEGAIYAMGFEAGAVAWRRFLRPGGVLAVTELTWLTAERPAEIADHWTREYPEVGTAAEKLAVLERRGYAPLGYFPLPARCWTLDYYAPLARRLDPFLAEHGGSPAARALVEATRREMALHDRFGAFFGYGFYVARRTP